MTGLSTLLETSYGGVSLTLIAIIGHNPWTAFDPSVDAERIKRDADHESRREAAFVSKDMPTDQCSLFALRVQRVLSRRVANGVVHGPCGFPQGP